MRSIRDRTCAFSFGYREPFEPPRAFVHDLPLPPESAPAAPRQGPLRLVDVRRGSGVPDWRGPNPGAPSLRYPDIPKLVDPSFRGATNLPKAESPLAGENF